MAAQRSLLPWKSPYVTFDFLSASIASCSQNLNTYCFKTSLTGEINRKDEGSQGRETQRRRSLWRRYKQVQPQVAETQLLNPCFQKLQAIEWQGDISHPGQCFVLYFQTFCQCGVEWGQKRSLNQMILGNPTPVNCFAQAQLVVMLSEKWCGPVARAQAGVGSPVELLTVLWARKVMWRL